MHQENEHLFFHVYWQDVQDLSQQHRGCLWSCQVLLSCEWFLYLAGAMQLMLSWWFCLQQYWLGQLSVQYLTWQSGLPLAANFSWYYGRLWDGGIKGGVVHYLHDCCLPFAFVSAKHGGHQQSIQWWPPPQNKHCHCWLSPWHWPQPHVCSTRQQYYNSLHEHQQMNSLLVMDIWTMLIVNVV